VYLRTDVVRGLKPFSLTGDRSPAPNRDRQGADVFAGIFTSGRFQPDSFNRTNVNHAAPGSGTHKQR
jgi:hypothetical protein